MKPIERGGLYGILNTIVVAGLVGGLLFQSAGMMLVIVMFGFVPGVLTGLALGMLAGALARQPVWLRSFAILVPALVVVLSLGALHPVAFAIAVFPTATLGLVLETQTRALQGPELPRAILTNG